MVEIANFDPIQVRKTGTRLGLRTDAELRFEKNIAPAGSMYALLHFLDQLKLNTTDLGETKVTGSQMYVAEETKSALLYPRTIVVDCKQMAMRIFGEERPDFTPTAISILEQL